MSTITTSAKASMLDGFEAFMLLGSGTANLTLYQTSVALCVFPLAASPFGAGNGSSLTLASTPISSTGTEVAGKANRWVITNQNGDTAASGTLSAYGGGGDLCTDALTITAAATQALNALVMRMQPDGTVFWEGSFTLV
jgi:hypothetical protein